MDMPRDNLKVARVRYIIEISGNAACLACLLSQNPLMLSFPRKVCLIDQSTVNTVLLSAKGKDSNLESIRRPR